MFLMIGVNDGQNALYYEKLVYFTHLGRAVNVTVFVTFTQLLLFFIPTQTSAAPWSGEETWTSPRKTASSPRAPTIMQTAALAGASKISSLAIRGTTPGPAPMSGTALTAATPSSKTSTTARSAASLSNKVAFHKRSVIIQNAKSKKRSSASKSFAIETKTKENTS